MHIVLATAIPDRLLRARHARTERFDGRCLHRQQHDSRQHEAWPHQWPDGHRLTRSILKSVTACLVAKPPVHQPCHRHPDVFPRTAAFWKWLGQFERLKLGAKRPGSLGADCRPSALEAEALIADILQPTASRPFAVDLRYPKSGHLSQ